MPLVVGTDLSEQSLDALRAAFALAQRRGDTEIFLVYVVDDDAAHDATEEQRGKLVGAAQQRLEADAVRLAAGTTITVKTEVLIGHADESLMAFAETEDADLVIITSVGQGKSKSGGRLGAVSEKLAVRASRPLLVVRDPQ